MKRWLMVALIVSYGITAYTAEVVHSAEKKCLHVASYCVFQLYVPKIPQ